MKTFLFIFPLLLIALGLAWAAVLLAPWGWLLLWPAGALVVVSAAYVVRWHGVFGKRPDGRLHPVHVLLLLPYLAAAWWAWRVRKWVWQEEPYTEIVENLYLGRRLGQKEMPDGVELVVDLTAEFRERPGVRNGRHYVCLPTLDGTAPLDEPFMRLVERVAGHPGRVYVHCAVGYGRSATLVGAVLLRRGLAERPGQAVHMLQTLRPGVAIGRGQYRLLRKIASDQEGLNPPV
jgi:protein-tyrosine phosphatase